MDERSPDTPPAGPARPVALSPIQRVWADYRRHTSACIACRSTDSGRCAEASQLWRTHQELCDEAYERLSASGS